MSSIHQHKPLYHRVELPGAERVNAAIWKQYQEIKRDATLRRSHFFAGRYENIYVERARVPSLESVLRAALDAARGILQQVQPNLAVGFWFNDMGPGHVTLPHSHEEDDELLSGVYYVRVPENSGQLILDEGSVRSIVTPAEGVFVFFAPHVMHEVSENRSTEERLSIGMNFGVRTP